MIDALAGIILGGTKIPARKTWRLVYGLYRRNRAEGGVGDDALRLARSVGINPLALLVAYSNQSVPVVERPGYYARKA